MIKELSFRVVCVIGTFLFHVLGIVSLELLLFGILAIPVVILLALQLWLAAAVVGACVITLALIGPVSNPLRKFSMAPYLGHHNYAKIDEWPSFPPLLGPGERIGTKGPWFTDALGRVLLLRGVNISGNCKLPVEPNGETWRNESKGFRSERGAVSFVGRPFPLSEADEHFSRLRAWGLTFCRLLITWEAIEHEGPGIYDREYIEYVVSLVQKAHEYGIVVFVDPHQDAWSRWTGGSGAPYWTLEAAGFNLDNLDETQAAITHQNWGDPLPRMIWGTNNWRLAASTMFTLFFAGDTFAPATTAFGVPREEGGVPIQFFLQDHYLRAVAEIARALRHEPNVVGFDTLNEPNCGLVGRHDMMSRTEGLAFRFGLNLSLWEQILAASGHCEAARPKRCYEGGAMAPAATDLFAPPFVKHKKVIINPDGKSAWGPGGCVWKANGVWAESSSGAVLLRPRHFALHQGETFIDNFLVPFWRKFETAIRAVSEPENPFVIFAEPIVDFSDPGFHPTPRLGPNGAEIVQTKFDGKVEKPSPLNGWAYVPHWYEVVNLVTKSYSPWIGLGQWTCVPIVGPVIGQNGMVRGYAAAFGSLRAAGNAINGGSGMPTLIGEVGIAMDLAGGAAWKGPSGRLGGDWTMQIRTLDNILGAMDANILSFTLWNYAPNNSNARGDGWNDEDLSLFSKDQMDSTAPLNPYSGGRALPAVVRPYARKINGIPHEMSFDLARRRFVLNFEAAHTDHPTEVFIPRYQYPLGIEVKISNGRFEYNEAEQALQYWHSKPGRHLLVVSPKLVL